MEIFVQTRVKNGLLQKAVEKCGSQSALARLLKVQPNTIGRWLNFNEVPKFRTKGIEREPYARWDATLVTLVGYGLDEIFPEELDDELLLQQAKEASRLEYFVEADIRKVLASGAAPRPQLGPAELVEQGELKAMIEEFFSKLPERHVLAVKLRFGLDGYREHTLQEAGEELGVTSARVRQMEEDVLRVLRHPARSRLLEHFLPNWEQKKEWREKFINMNRESSRQEAEA